MKIRGLIFDLDGTLLNTLSDIADSMNAVLSDWGFPLHSTDMYRYFVGEGMDVLVHKSLPQELNDPEIIDACFLEMKQRYAAHWNDKTVPYEGIRDALAHLKDNGYSLSVLSNKIHEFTVKTVYHYFDPAQFNFIIGAGLFKKKPDPQAALYIAKSSGFDTSEILFVGDSGVDMRTAVAAGMHSAGVLWGFREKVEMAQNGAEYLIDKPSEIISLLDQIN
jgi:phosphoglycolate phosphatase